jgi:hypothetical protein
MKNGLGWMDGKDEDFEEWWFNKIWCFYINLIMSSLNGYFVTLALLLMVECQHLDPVVIIDNTTGIDEEKLIREDKKYHEVLS